MRHASSISPNEIREIDKVGPAGTIEPRFDESQPDVRTNLGDIAQTLLAPGPTALAAKEGRRAVRPNLHLARW